MKSRNFRNLLLCSAIAVIPANVALADDEDDVIVVTGVVSSAGKNKLETSISVSSLNYEDIQNSAPRSTAEIFRALPGIRSESSAGGGNSNIAVRGMPLSTGGAKYVSLQEDGLPIMLFGDFDFAPADGFYKVDSTLSRVESVRGGTASTLTTNGPGGIINFISKTGKTEGGSIALTTGLGYNDFRGDAEYGGPINDTMYFHIGGHYQQGGDYRDFGFDAISGGQLKASITKEFETGYFRLNAKWMDKSDATYMPQAAGLINGRVRNTIGGFSANNDSLHSPQIRFGRDVDGENSINNYDLADGIRTKIKAIGMEASFDLGHGIQFDNKARYQDISGNFNAPFTNSVFNADARINGGTATFFNGPNAGQAITSASLGALNGNSLITEVAYFNTDIDDMSNFTDELKLSKSFDTQSGVFDVTAGYFFMNQKFSQDWHWNRFLTDTTSNASLIDIAGETDNGILGYNQAFGWNGNNRNYDMEFQASSPFFAGSWSGNNGLTVDASIRFDNMRQRGTRTEAIGGAFDVDGDGVIDPPEQDVSLNTGVGGIANFSVNNTAYTGGINYLIHDDLSVFARYSSGAAFNGERQLFTSLNAGGQLLPGGSQTYVDTTEQFEAGIKWSESGDQVPGDLDLFITVFNANTNEDNFEITTQTALINSYNSKGVETEVRYNYGMFNLMGSFTITDAEITDSVTAAGNIGNTPRRQADLIWSVTPSFVLDGLGRAGFNWTGTTDTFVDDNNVFVQPGFSVFNLFANWDVTESATISVNVNNVFDATGFTEAENGRTFDTDGDGTPDVIVARSINGRTASATLRYRF